MWKGGDLDKCMYALGILFLIMHATCQMQLIE